MFGMFKNMFSSTSSQDIKEAVEQGAFLVDVRSASEFAGGSVKGAVNIPLDKISSQISKFKGRDKIVVFCLSGGRSGQAKSLLQQNGIENVINGGSWHNVKDAIGG
ncbi:rhodanese-like domain-containing protein [Riemerella anatipestifer]|nr:rhodanese-like domain-containing protein [Riemerella anatipestifer]MDY3363382.1 rhodanese-like domain-containing protein [Riemerella anatipestifer]MDY3520073.1 rhodanese-like domain-containing protein [Riemerella anatipestifer]MDY3532757.1 rhodanese-like domain-containing protein [Riemerella anatipestifer]MDY3534688.1 rhodanese-like domain-containing protein [Riemerella anatipestifer]